MRIKNTGNDAFGFRRIYPQFAKYNEFKRAFGKENKKMEKKLFKIVNNKDFEKNLLAFRSDMEIFWRIFKKRKYATPHKLFFSIEELPPTGKEYWFLHFCTPGKEEQAVMTFGRALENVKVNKTEVRQKLDGKEMLASKKMASANNFCNKKIDCGAVCWFYSSGKGKKVALNSKTSVCFDEVRGRSSLNAKNAQGEIGIRADGKKFSVSFSAKGKKYFEASAFPPKKSIPFEIITMLKPPIMSGLGAVMVNYYYDFCGKCGGKKIKGKAYLQKVVAVLPLAPWNWARIYFTSGAVLDFFAAKPLGGEKEPLRIGYTAYLEQNGKRTKINGLVIDSWFEGKKRLWLLHGPNFFLSMQSYAKQTFFMKAKTTFVYDEYLVKAKELEASVGGKILKLKDVGEGSGIVEDSSGYLI